MKVAVNCWVLRNKKLDGIGYFTVNTISSLIRNNPDVQFVILCDKKFTEDYFNFPNVQHKHIFPALRHPVLYVWYMEFVLPFVLRRLKPDVFLSMEGFLSLLSSAKQVPVLYDINFEHQPGDLKWKNRIYYRFFFKRFARKAKRIATISEYSKKDIATFYKIDVRKIDNVSCGVNPGFEPMDPADIAAWRTQWTQSQPYFFFVGSMHPRKNIQRLIEAFTLFKQQTGSPFKLVLAGSILWSKTAIEDVYNNSPVKQDILFTGRLSDADLGKMLGAAYALSFVPIFEGFGLPIVEAMQSGVPVLCSNVTSMPEVAGDAAILVDPFDIHSIAAGMQKLATDNMLCRELVSKGHVQKQQFTWNRTAALLWQTLFRVIEGKEH